MREARQYNDEMLSFVGAFIHKKRRVCQGHSGVERVYFAKRNSEQPRECAVLLKYGLFCKFHARGPIVDYRNAGGIAQKIGETGKELGCRSFLCAFVWSNLCV